MHTPTLLQLHFPSLPQTSSHKKKEYDFLVEVACCIHLPLSGEDLPSWSWRFIAHEANPITQLSDAKSPLMALHGPELRMMMLAVEGSAHIPYWNHWSLCRVTPWLCSLMDSVLSVKGSQIYRQRAFNKKQVAHRQHGRATKDVNTCETERTQ